MATARGHVTPLLRRGRGQGEPCRWHTAGCPQGDHAMPMRVGDGSLALFLVVATVREDDDLTRILGPESVFQGQRLDVLHHEVMRSAIRQRMIPALAWARARDGTKRHQQVIEDHHALGPRMPNDTSLAMLERLGVFGMQTGAMVERTLHSHRPMPGPLWHRVPGLGNVRGLLLGEALQRRDCDRALGLHHLRAWGLVPFGKPGGFFAGMCRGHDHHTQQRTGAEPCKTSTDPETPRDPSLPGASPPGASSLSPLDRERVAYERGNKARGPAALENDAVCAIKGGASLGSNNVGALQRATTPEQCVETPQGGRDFLSPALIGSRRCVSLEPIVY